LGWPIWCWPSVGFLNSTPSIRPETGKTARNGAKRYEAASLKGLATFRRPEHVLVAGQGAFFDFKALKNPNKSAFH
jgi:hypothetical protein